MAIRLDDIIGSMGLSNRRALERKSCSPDLWDMETMLEAVRRIGISYEPRFVIDDSNRKVYENLIYWFMNDSRMTAIDPVTRKDIPGRLDRGIYLAGNTGSGKTLAMRILMRLYGRNRFTEPGGGCRIDPCTGSSITSRRAVDWLETRADEIAEEFARKGSIKEFKDATLISVQDLGSEPPETVYMGNRANVIRLLMEYRGDRECVTMVTSNIPLGHDDIVRRYGDRARSRMIEMMNYIELAGEDRRMNI